MSESEQHFDSTEQAYAAGINKGKELQQQADAEAKEEQGRNELTFEDVQKMPMEEQIERKAEVDAVLEKQGRER